MPVTRRQQRTNIPGRNAQIQQQPKTLAYNPHHPACPESDTFKGRDKSKGRTKDAVINYIGQSEDVQTYALPRLEPFDADFCPEDPVRSVNNLWNRLHVLRDCLKNEVENDAKDGEKIAMYNQLESCLGEFCEREKAAKAENISFAEPTDIDVDAECCEIERDLVMAEIAEFKESLDIKSELMKVNKCYIVALRKVERLAECEENLERKLERARCRLEEAQREVERLKNEVCPQNGSKPSTPNQKPSPTPKPRMPTPKPAIHDDIVNLDLNLPLDLYG